MANAVVEDYVRERNQHLNTINVLTATAKERGSDPTDQDLEAIQKCQARIRKLDNLIEILGENFEMSQEMADKLTRLQPGVVPAAPKYRSAGELLWDCIHGNYGSQHDRDDQDAVKRWGLVMKRAAEHMGTTAAATTPVAGGFGGLYVAPVVGPVIDLYPAGRPFVTAIGTQPAPNSLTFVRPRIVDPDFKTAAAVQTLQKQELASKKFDVAIDNLTLATVGGYLNVSQQLLSLHPSSLDIITGQLQKRVAWQSEAAGIAQISTTTAEIPLAANADAKAVLKAVYDAAALYYANTFSLPSWITMGVTGWARLGSLVDAANRPMFPFLGAQNALGQMAVDTFTGTGPAGLTPIVTPGITTPDLFVGGNDSLEAYEYSFPVLEAIEPSVLGRQVAVASAMCFFMPTTKEATTSPVAPAEHNSVVKIEWAA